MNAEEVKKELATAPWVSTALMIEVVRAFGGTIIMGDETSKQGGTHVTGAKWPNGRGVDIDKLRQPLHVMNEIAELGHLVMVTARLNSNDRVMYDASVVAGTSTAPSMEGAIWLAALEAGIKPYRT